MSANSSEQTQRTTRASRRAALRIERARREWVRRVLGIEVPPRLPAAATGRSTTKQAA